MIAPAGSLQLGTVPRAQPPPLLLGNLLGFPGMAWRREKQSQTWGFEYRTLVMWP